MPYNIVIASHKFFSPSPSGTQFMTNWVFNPATPPELHYVLGSADLAVLNIESTIKNYLLLHGTGNVIIRAFLNVTTPGLNGKVVLGGLIKAATPATPISLTDKTGYIITTSNLEVTNTLTFTGLSQLVQGIYDINITFIAYRTASSDVQPVHLETIKYDIKLIAGAVAQISVAPNTLFFSHLKDYTLPATQNITITEAGNWSLRLDKKFTATAAGTVDNSTATETIITGVGNKVVAIGITTAFNTINTDIFQAQALITSGSGSTAFVNITVNIFQDANFKVTPASLEFKAVRGFNQADSQSINVVGFGAFTLEAPSWLQLSAYSGSYSGTFVVDPVSANNLTSGEYKGFIIIKNNVTEFQLPVTYIVEGTVNTLLLPDKFNFTKDLHYININNVNLDTQNIVKILLTVRVYSYKLNKETVHTFNYTEPFFDYSASFHPGEIVERLMAKINGISDFNLENLFPASVYNPVYKPASADVNIKIVNRITAAVMVEENLNNLLFIAGKKPPTYVNNGAILSNSSHIKRVTPTSKELLNFVVPNGVYEVKFQKNKEDIVSLASRNTGTHNVFQYFFDFSAYAAGDVITIFIHTSGSAYKKTYQVIPEGDYSFHIGFINQFKVLELLEVTGGCTLSSDIKKITHKYYRDLVERIETLDSTNDMKFLVNTGPIFKNDQFILDEICRGKLAWLIFNDKPAIELIAVDKKLVNYDTDQALYDYELEFDINRKHDAENYSF